jgi:acyl carrier protein
MTEDRRERIRLKLNDVFREVFEDDTLDIHAAMTAKDIDTWDSLMHIVLIVAIEKAFAVQLSASEIGRLENVGAFLTLLEERTSG